MFIIDIIPVLLISIVGAVTDIRFGRVKNLHLIVVIALWVLLNIVNAIAFGRISLSVAWGINLGFSLITSIIFYITDIWAPGDCKLFCTIVLMFPLYMYPKRFGNIYPALDFVIYAFASGYLALLGISLYKKLDDKNALSINNYSLKLSPERIISIASSIGFMTAIHTALGVFFSFFYESNRILCSLSIIGLLCLIQVRAKKAKMLLGVFGLVFLVVLTILFQTWDRTLTNIIVCMLLSVLIDIINDSTRANTYRVVSGNDVKPGMILSYSTVLSMQQCIDPNIPHTTTENRRSRITELQAEAVKMWCKNAKSDIVIVEMIPFAPFICLAVVIEIIRYFSLK